MLPLIEKEEIILLLFGVRQDLTKARVIAGILPQWMPKHCCHHSQSSIGACLIGEDAWDLTALAQHPLAVWCYEKGSVEYPDQGGFLLVVVLQRVREAQEPILP